MTPFGREIRKLRIDADVTMGEMAKQLGKKPSYMSAVELGDKPLSDDLARSIIGYLKSLPYFKHHRLDERYLMRLADRSRNTINVQELPERKGQWLSRFASVAMKVHPVLTWLDSSNTSFLQTSTLNSVCSPSRYLDLTKDELIRTRCSFNFERMCTTP